MSPSKKKKSRTLSAAARGDGVVDPHTRPRTLGRRAPPRPSQRDGPLADQTLPVRGAPVPAGQG